MGFGRLCNGVIRRDPVRFGTDYELVLGIIRLGVARRGMDYVLRSGKFRRVSVRIMR